MLACVDRLVGKSNYLEKARGNRYSLPNIILVVAAWHVQIYNQFSSSIHIKLDFPSNGNWIFVLTVNKFFGSLLTALVADRWLQLIITFVIFLDVLA